MCEELGNVISYKTLYISVLQDRHSFKKKFKKMLGIDELEVNDDFDSDTDSIMVDTDEDCTIKDEDYFLVQNNNTENTLFKISIPYKKYEQFEPSTLIYKDKKNKRSYDVLKKNTWSDIINDEFIAKYNLPCNFVYKSCKVRKTMIYSKYFLTFKAKCKDDGCELFGWSEKKPDIGQPLEISILTKDTRKCNFIHESKRPLRGFKRKEVGQQLLTDLASNWRRDNVKDMEFGDMSPPNLYKSSVLRKAKQQHKDNILGITQKNQIESVVELKRNSRFSGSIHEVGTDPLLVHYWTGHQLTIYKDLCKNYCRISIDATGGLIKKTTHSSLNILSAHIFLYEVVINTYYGQIPISQMLSEKQDALTIFNWLARWKTFARKSPNEVVCDFSMALLGAISMAFCKIFGIKSYVEQCFGVATEQHTKLPDVYLRIDVAHVIKIFCRNKYLQGKTNKNLKSFYVRGMRLLITSTSLVQFKEVLIALLNVMLSETDGWADNFTETPSETSRKFLLGLIKGNYYII